MSRGWVGTFGIYGLGGGMCALNFNNRRLGMVILSILCSLVWMRWQWYGCWCFG